VGAFLEKRVSAAATAREIEKACREFGFFYATGHGVGLDKSQRRRLAEAIMRKGVSPPSLDQCRYTNSRGRRRRPTLRRS